MIKLNSPEIEIALKSSPVISFECQERKFLLLHSQQE